MKKKLFMLLLVAFSACILVGCGGNDTTTLNKTTYDITVWVSETEGVAALTQTQIAKFNEENPLYSFNATVEGVSEGESATQMITSVEDGADIYCFAQDQLNRLILAGALNKLGVAASQTVTELNDSASVSAATVGENLYCYPLTSDNGYYMYYDTSVIPEADLGSLETLIADCEKAGKMFSFQLEGSGWYNASFFFATGCSSVWDTDVDGNFTAVHDTFNSAEGIIALEGMQKLLKSTCYLNSQNASDFSAAVPSAIVISGTWDSAIAQAALGENYGATKLPSFTVDGKTYQLGSYNGSKLMGVKPQADATKAAALQALALYLTGETCQQQRLDQFGWGPSNKVVQTSDSFKSNVALKALAEQNEFAVVQGQIQGKWWDISKTYATAAKKAELNDTEALQAALDAYTKALGDVISMPADEKEAFGVVGSVASMTDTEGWTAWSTDIKMTQKGSSGVWYTNAPILLTVGDEFKVRQGGGWTVNFGVGEAVGGDNIVIETTGYYYVKLVYDKDANTGVVTLEKNSPLSGWTVIGSMNSDTWSIDIQMAVQEDGTTYKTVEPITFVAGDEFKVRQAEDWTVAYGDGGANFVVETAGSYYVQIAFDAEGAATVSLVAAE